MPVFFSPRTGRLPLFAQQVWDKNFDNNDLFLPGESADPEDSDKPSIAYGKAWVLLFHLRGIYKAAGKEEDDLHTGWLEGDIFSDQPKDEVRFESNKVRKVPFYDQFHACDCAIVSSAGMHRDM